jgi:hypothetical protein
MQFEPAYLGLLANLAARKSSTAKTHGIAEFTENIVRARMQTAVALRFSPQVRKGKAP